jgi:formylglycine-generating enzyme required for sulfatase activity
VLPLDTSHAKKKLDADGQASLEEMLRDVAAEALTTFGWTILTGETILQVLQDNGVDPTKCGDQNCHLTMAREIKAEKFLSGAVQYVDGAFTASIRLIDTTTGQILASERVEGPNVTALRRAFEAKAGAFFVKGGLVGAAPSRPEAATPVPKADPDKPRVQSGAVTEVEGSLTVTARPRDAVRLELTDPDRKTVTSAAPYENKHAAPGRWHITASASGYASEDQTVDVPADDLTVVKFDLKPLGALAITGTPTGAAVAVTGPAGFQNDGGLPWEAEGLRSGTYRVRVTRKGYADFEGTAEVTPGGKQQLKVALEKAGSVTHGAAKTEPRSGLEFVWIPGGTFHYGCEPGDTDCSDLEKPGRPETVAGFWFGRTVVTVEAYAKCVHAGVCPVPDSCPAEYANWEKPGHERYPANCVPWEGTVKFCGWIGGRLPSAIEWEFAAKGGESRRYPWGNTGPDATRARFGLTTNAGTSPVDAYPAGASKHGLLGMAGNAGQWTTDKLSPDATYMEVRGGYWMDSADRLRTSARSDTSGGGGVTTRCVLPP